ncbi:hypothetical protein CONPUDRAFT_71844 [Coniophora puteana RWD-64-598 SS2]|uniref:Uncharacterized protein n=1 Tax=Coniophora puteana (strain RWD-64-598) TaxID=741705 RepID=A0A5M3MVU2_CONPW|nr:uncharacterized protein CONPUDRAFT_71844 [Coniophora puteana RWD-64-598 SS2]EIW83253.1 hypothetical protein CONPUDRAFT_71844 [Coniophora puteana RWD-64-598 SS2]
MSSTSLEQEILQEAILVRNYSLTCAAAMTLAGYDYLLSLGDEKFATFSSILSEKETYIDNSAVCNRPLSLHAIQMRYIVLICAVAILWSAVVDRSISAKASVWESFPKYLNLSSFCYSKVVTIALSISLISPGESYFEDTELLTAYYCTNTLPTDQAEVWEIPYSIKQTPISLWRTPSQGAVNLTWIIVRDNLSYFFIALASMVIAMMTEIPSLNEAVLLTMAGPWMMISLRRSYSVALELGTVGSNEPEDEPTGRDVDKSSPKHLWVG